MVYIHNISLAELKKMGENLEISGSTTLMDQKVENLCKGDTLIVAWLDGVYHEYKVEPEGHLSVRDLIPEPVEEFD